MTGLRELYQEVILDHNKHPRNYGETDGADYQADGYNPLCGDRLVVYLKVHEGKITEVTFVGSGCAISKASASLMTDAVKGLSLTAAKELFDQFHTMITDKVERDFPEELGKLAVLAGVRDYPTRIKCASMAWHTLRSALDNNKGSVSTE